MINLSNTLRISLFLLSLCLWSCTPNNQQTEENSSKPNILLIVADDLGYADLGCYGGDIETPNIDLLASEGIRFSRFHTAMMCAPTRAMLLSGNDNHIAGMGAQGSRREAFGYESRLTDRIVTIPQVLQQAGYHAYITGKWHLGIDSLSIPHNKGFEHSFVCLLGGANHYDDQGLFRSFPKTPYSEDGEKAEWPKGAYSTNLYTDKMISFIEGGKEDGRPFFAFLAYTSPHWPLQVDESYWKKYEGRYDEGYEVLKAKRLGSLKEAGMVPKDAVLPVNHPRVTPWDSLSVEEQKKEARKMELYAGMVDNLDENIGRLIDYLKESGQYDNTLIVFMSDNGAAAEDFYDHPNYGSFLQQHFTDMFPEMGLPHSFISYGPQWAEAGSAPFRYFKTESTEGGNNAPMIMAGPGITRGGDIDHSFLTLLDIAPTFYELAGAEYPQRYNEKTVYPLKGASLLPLLSDASREIHGPDYVFGMEHYLRVFIRKGNWKLVNTWSPFEEENFELFDLSKDLAEQHDLKNAEPEKFQEMLQEWEKYKEESRVDLNIFEE